MNTTSHLAGALESAFEHPTGGVVGLVDDLLRLCPEQGLQFHWQADRCRIRSPANGSEDLLNCHLGKSVFRAILARLATLCNQRTPNSVSPFGGQGELLIGVGPPTIFKVAFTNTTDEQELELIPVPEQEK